ncbi:MAG: PExPT-CTERM protein [Acidobacteriota bacterium]|nr:PExPT-CTERM protein [Acidobacteriota bacterium]
MCRKNPEWKQLCGALEQQVSYGNDRKKSKGKSKSDIPVLGKTRQTTGRKALTTFPAWYNFRAEAVMKKLYLLAAFVLVAAAASPLYAQTGCTNSPENPTALLAIVGSAGAFIASARRRFRK